MPSIIKLNRQTVIILGSEITYVVYIGVIVQTIHNQQNNLKVENSHLIERIIESTTYRLDLRVWEFVYHILFYIV